MYRASKQNVTQEMEYQDDRAALASAARLARYYISCVTLCVTLFLLTDPVDASSRLLAKKVLENLSFNLQTVDVQRRFRLRPIQIFWIFDPDTELN